MEFYSFMSSEITAIGLVRNQTVNITGDFRVKGLFNSPWLATPVSLFEINIHDKQRYSYYMLLHSVRDLLSYSHEVYM